MKKIIIITFSFILVAMASFAQDASVSTDTKKKCNTSIEECAKKMGMTVAECKKACSKICGTKVLGSSTNVAASEATADIVEETSAIDKKTCSMSIEECAKKMGITVQECKKICKAKGIAATDKDMETKVASALSSSEAVPVKEKGSKKCCASSKKSCKK